MNNILLNLDEKINLYDLLEIDSKSTNKEIRKAWKKLALKYHPDKNNNASSEKFLKIKHAYDILSNEELRKQYDNKLNFYEKNSMFGLNFNFNFNFMPNLLELNLKKFLVNFIDSTEMEKIIKLILRKKEFVNNLLDFSNGSCKNLDDFIKKITDIVIVQDFDLKDIWECNPKIIKYSRCTRDNFEELIYPIDFEQIYENEGEQIIINNIEYRGNIIVKINIINTFYNGENYYIYNDNLYVLIDNKRIKNNKFTLNFLNGNKYKFDITKLKKITNNLGVVYGKKNFGLPGFILDNTNTNINNIEKNIMYNDLFFIIV